MTKIFSRLQEVKTKPPRQDYQKKGLRPRPVLKQHLNQSVVLTQ